MDVVNTDRAPKALGPYSQAVTTNDFCFLSGQIGLDPAIGELVSQDFTEQAEQIFKNMTAVLHAASLSLKNIIKLTIYLKDITQFPLLNSVMLQHFQEGHYPARSTVEVSGLPKNAVLEIEAIALR